MDIFSGPSLAFERESDSVEVNFLPWHRRWSHSLTFAAGLALAVAACTALGEWWLLGRPSQVALWGGLMVLLGLIGHILEDQLGYLGSNLFYPFTRRRTAGFGLFHSGDALPNFLAVWASLGLIVHNLNRFSLQPMLDPRWLFAVVALPIVVSTGRWVWRGGHRSGHVEAARRQEEILSELEEPQMG